MVVSGILIGLGVFIFGRVTSGANKSVVSNNVATVVTSIQEMGAQRLGSAGFSYSGTPADDGDADLAKAPAGHANTVTCEMIRNLEGRTSGIKFRALIEPDTPITSASGCGLASVTVGTNYQDPVFKAKAIAQGDANTVWVGVSVVPSEANGIPAGHLARVVGKVDDYTVCSVLVRSTTEAGIGHDSWEKKDNSVAAGAFANGNTWVTSSGKLNEKYEAHCPIQGDNVASTAVHFGPPLGLANAGGSSAFGLAPADFDLNKHYFSIKPAEGRDAIHAE